jgi:hypothetical protein
MNVSLGADLLFESLPTGYQKDSKLPQSALEEHKSHICRDGFEYLSPSFVQMPSDRSKYLQKLGASAELTPVNLAADAKNLGCCEKQSASAKSPELDFFDIGSARIQYVSKEGGFISQNKVNTAKEKAQRIYSYLGLTFNKLFSGGEAPPTTLLNLVSTNNAFVSLSTMTLVNMGDDLHNTATNSSKRHDKAIGLCQSLCEYLRLIGILSPICQLIFNMFDCIYGDFGGKEYYTTMAEVMEKK